MAPIVKPATPAVTPAVAPAGRAAAALAISARARPLVPPGVMVPSLEIGAEPRMDAPQRLGIDGFNAPAAALSSAVVVTSAPAALNTGPSAAATAVQTDGDILAHFGITGADLPILEARMRPGPHESGFLGEGESLGDVLRNDFETLKRLGITHHEISDLLGQVVSGRTNHYQVIIGGKKFAVDAVAWLGHEECPFGRQVEYVEADKRGIYHYQHDFGNVDYMLDVHSRGSQDFTVTSIENGERLKFGGLLVHLIGEHGFFEGPTSSYRLSPERVVSFFGMDRGNRAAELVHTPQYKYEGLAMPVLVDLSILSYAELCSKKADEFSAFNAHLDELSFIPAETRVSWKQQLVAVIDDIEIADKEKRRAIRSLEAEIEAAVIMAAGFVPKKYFSEGTRSLLPSEIGRFRIAKNLMNLAAYVGENVKIGREYYYDGHPTLLEAVMKWINPRIGTFSVCYIAFELIRPLVEDISRLMQQHGSYAAGKTELDALLTQLNEKVGREFDAAKRDLDSDME